MPEMSVRAPGPDADPTVPAKSRSPASLRIYSSGLAKRGGVPNVSLDSAAIIRKENSNKPRMPNALLVWRGTALVKQSNAWRVAALNQFAIIYHSAPLELKRWALDETRLFGLLCHHHHHHHRRLGELENQLLANEPKA